MIEHLKQCERYKNNKCPLNCSLILKPMSKSETIEHIKNNCPLMIFKCKVCHEIKPKNKLSDHYPNICLKNMQVIYKKNNKEIENLDKEYTQMLKKAKDLGIPTDTIERIGAPPSERFRFNTEEEEEARRL